MLVLERRIGDDIVIGQDVTVRVVDIREDCVRLGVEAPRDVSVDRAEVRDRKNGTTPTPGCGEPGPMAAFRSILARGGVVTLSAGAEGDVKIMVTEKDGGRRSAEAGNFASAARLVEPMASRTRTPARTR